MKGNSKIKITISTITEGDQYAYLLNFVLFYQNVHIKSKKSECCVTKTIFGVQIYLYIAPEFLN